MDNIVIYSLFKFVQHEQFAKIADDITSQYILRLEPDESVLHVFKKLKPGHFIKKHLPSHKKPTSEHLADTCSICLDLYTTNTYVRTLPCAHMFHKKCVDKWLKKTFQCPYCRHAYTIPLEKVMDIDLNKEEEKEEEEKEEEEGKEEEKNDINNNDDI
jgi:hypothetical protein